MFKVYNNYLQDKRVKITKLGTSDEIIHVKLLSLDLKLA